MKIRNLNTKRPTQGDVVRCYKLNWIRGLLFGGSSYDEKRGVVQGVNWETHELLVRFDGKEKSEWVSWDDLEGEHFTDDLDLDFPEEKIVSIDDLKIGSFVELDGHVVVVTQINELGELIIQPCNNIIEYKKTHVKNVRAIRLSEKIIYNYLQVRPWMDYYNSILEYHFPDTSAKFEFDTKNNLMECEGYRVKFLHQLQGLIDMFKIVKKKE